MLLAGLLALFAWFTTYGLFAIFLRTRLGDNKMTCYLAEASYWVYLIHLPFVGLTQIAIAQLPAPTLAKFLLTGLTALALSLMTYHVFVRDKWLGEFLDGHRRFRTPATHELQSVESQFPTLAPNYANAVHMTRSVHRVTHRLPLDG